jgi:NAD(P)-dependent dehydrogenase (short-subunit alcohol dehydrogenase family)
VPERRGLLEGRRALVTGAGRGIGLATARRFCEEGAGVALSDVVGTDEAVAALRADGHEAHAVPFDVTDEEAVEAGVARAEEALGGLDTLVANAGVYLDRPALETSLDDLRRVLEVNLVGVFACARAAGRRFVARGGGTILATASQAGRHGYPGQAAYGASKFGVVGLVEVLAKELGPAGVRVACVAPGLIRTDMFDRVVEGQVARGAPSPGDVVERFETLVPLRRLGTPEDVANAFVYLASDLASWISGTALVVDGGEGS